MSPLCVEILLWHYCRANQYPEWHAGSAQAALRAWLLDEELLSAGEDVPQEYSITDKGRSLVEAICNTPMPVQKWVAA